MPDSAGHHASHSSNTGVCVCVYVCVCVWFPVPCFFFAMAPHLDDRLARTTILTHLPHTLIQTHTHTYKHAHTHTGVRMALPSPENWWGTAHTAAPPLPGGGGCGGGPEGSGTTRGGAALEGLGCQQGGEGAVGGGRGMVGGHAGRGRWQERHHLERHDCRLQHGHPTTGAACVYVCVCARVCVCTRVLPVL
jgi:hypothetical protein